jgi:hypothetical protein
MGAQMSVTPRTELEREAELAGFYRARSEHYERRMAQMEREIVSLTNEIVEQANGFSATIADLRAVVASLQKSTPDNLAFLTTPQLWALRESVTREIAARPTKL